MLRGGVQFPFLLMLAVSAVGCGATRLLPQLTPEERAILNAPARRPKAGVRADDEKTQPFLGAFFEDIKRTEQFSEVVFLHDSTSGVDVILELKEGCQAEWCMPMLYALTLGIIPDTCEVSGGYHFDIMLPGSEDNRDAIIFCNHTTMALGIVFIPLGLSPNWTWLRDAFWGHRYWDRFALAMTASPQLQKLRRTTE